MTILVPIVLYGWVPLVLVLFRDLKSHRALAAAYVIAWLFLPTNRLRFSVLPDINKASATSFAVMVAILLFEPRRLWNVRPHWLDLPILLYCLSPIPSSLHNELGIWDGCSNSLQLFLLWGMPYFFGRLYFDSFDKLKSLAKAVFIGGLVYVPFCLVEMRMSPQFHTWVYGLRPKSTLHSRRYGGWRPSVFLDTGLELGMWMTAACLVGFALWYSGALKKVYGIRASALLAVLVPTTVLCKSTGSLLLLVGGLGMLLAMRWLRTPWLILCVTMVPLTYIPVRSSGISDGQPIVDVAEAVFGSHRAESLKFRFHNENLLAERAWKSPIFGWGGWGRERVTDEFGKDQTIIDGMWIAMFGKFGLLGLITFTLTWVITPTWAILRFARPKWHYDDVAPLIGICLVLLLYLIDCLLNAMDNALYPLCLGAVTTLLILPFRQLIASTDWQADEEESMRVRRRRLWPPERPRPGAAEPALPSRS